MLLICVMSGMLISAILGHSEVEERAQEKALFLEGVFSTMLQGAADGGSISAEDTARIDALMSNKDFANRFPYLEIWLPSGEIAYSNSAVLVGRKLALPRQAKEAFEGTIGFAFADLNAEEHTLRGFEANLLEVYAPVHRLGGDDVIAVVEIHETTEALNQQLAHITLLVWSFIVVGAAVAIASLSGIVLRGSRTIQMQRQDLAERLRTALRLKTQVGEVQEAQRASESAVRLAENRLKLASADLHDGPSQLINFALLKAHEISLAKDKDERDAIVLSIRTSLITALTEIRSISQGLTLPDIANLSLDAIIDLAVAAHQKRTGVAVAREGTLHEANGGLETKIAVYRIVQEGLINATRHSQGSQVAILVDLTGRTVRIQLTNLIVKSDQNQTSEMSQMGLEGIKARVEILGGHFSAGVEGDYFFLRVLLDLGSIHG